MKTSIGIKSALSYPLYRYNIIEKLFKNKNKNCYFILMFHRIIHKKEPDVLLQGGMYVDLNTFKKQILYLNNKYTIISLDKILNIIDLKLKGEVNKPYCIFTFDDGWKDFYENAYPILLSFKIHATVFLPTDYIGTNKQFWTDKLAHILCKMEKEDSAFINSRYKNIIKDIGDLRGSVEARLESAVKILKSLPMENIEQILDEIAERLKLKSEADVNSFLSWEEVREMYNSGIVSFGSHTKSHKILTTASEKVIQDELLQSRKKLIEEGVVSPSFIPFTYPNGNYTDKIAKMVKEAGYALALTTESGWNHMTDNKNELFQLKRIGIHQDISSTDAMLACRIYGIY